MSDKTALIFDVDGTLTPPHGIMHPGFKRWFLDLQEEHAVYLVTGNERARTEAQLGSDIFRRCKMVFNCCGNEAWEGDRLIYRNDWVGTPELIEALEEELEIASFRLRTGQHIQHKTGLINFSVIGRGSDRSQRDEYMEYDRTRFERRSIITRLKNRFYDLDLAIAGEIGMDIYPKGRGKSQALEHMTETRTIFFGDEIFFGGNDDDIAAKCTEYHRVQNWEQTWDILKLSTSK